MKDEPKRQRISLWTKGYDAAYGGRPMKRAIQKYVEDPLAEEIIKSGVSEGDTVKSITTRRRSIL